MHAEMGMLICRSLVHADERASARIHVVEAELVSRAMAAATAPAGELIFGFINELGAGKLDWVGSLRARPSAKDWLAPFLDADGGRDDAEDSSPLCLPGLAG
jgi:hypothetical protein